MTDAEFEALPSTVRLIVDTWLASQRFERSDVTKVVWRDEGAMLHVDITARPREVVLTVKIA